MARTFSFSSQSYKRLTEFYETWQKTWYQHNLPIFVWYVGGGGNQKTKTTTLAFDRLRSFRRLLCSRWKEYNDTCKNNPQSCFEGGDPKIRIAALASDLLRHFEFLSATTEWNSETFVRKQDLNVRFFFSGRLKYQEDHPNLWLTETFSTSLKPLNRM